MVYHFALKTGPENREILPETFSELSHICAFTDVNQYHRGFMRWHWHDVFEIDYVKEGAMQLLLPEETVELHQGDVAFINEGVLHAYQSRDRESCIVYAHLFTMGFLSGMYNSVLERKYILPVRESSLQVYAFSADSPRRLQMTSTLTWANELCEKEPFGYEFDLRSSLCSFWKNLFLETEELRADTASHSLVDIERIKKMIEYVRENYAQKLSLDEIAAAADISSRECTRCFHRCLGMTPIQYVTQYRLQAATDLLLSTTESVLEISEACGFSSPSYFSRTFSEALGCTPKKYRAAGGAVMQSTDCTSVT